MSRKLQRLRRSIRLTGPAVLAGLGLSLTWVNIGLAVTATPDRSRLLRIYERPEFVLARRNQALGNWLNEVLAWLLRKLQPLLPNGDLRVLGWLGAGLIALLAVAGVLWVRRHLRGSAALAKASLASGAVSPREMEAEAQRLAAAGRWAEAVRQLVRTLLLHLDRRGVLAFDPARTNREVLRHMQARHRATVPALRRLLTAADEVTYGGRRASQPIWQEAENGYREALAGLAAEGEANP